VVGQDRLTTPASVDRNMSLAESEWRMWGTHTCQQMQAIWKLCSATSDVNYTIPFADGRTPLTDGTTPFTTNCPYTCSKYGVVDNVVPTQDLGYVPLF
jgi:hypothetical protein